MPDTTAIQTTETDVFYTRRVPHVGVLTFEHSMERELELSNYWDDFEKRVAETAASLVHGEKPPLERLTVHLTNRCNFRCRYCNMSFCGQDMDQALAEKIVAEYAEMGGNIIHFTGGEPTIVPYFEDICAFAKDSGLQVSSNTNVFKKVDSSNIDKLKASFDTPYAEKFDATVGIDGAFDRVVENMREYSSEMKDKMLSITAVCNKKTYKDMLALARFVEENFDVYNLYFSNYKGANPTFTFDDTEIEELFSTCIPETLEFFKETGNEYSHRQLSLYRLQDFANTPIRFPENKVIPCRIQLSEMTIDVDGTCHNCSHLFRDGVRIDNAPNVAKASLAECFAQIKSSLNGNYTCLSEKCLSGCNINLIGFNATVDNALAKR